MSEEIPIFDEDEIAENASSAEQVDLFNLIRNVLVAGMESMTASQARAQQSRSEFMSGASTLIEQLVERGQLAEKEGRELLGEMSEKRWSFFEEKRQGARAKVKSRLKMRAQSAEAKLNKVAHRFNLPTRSDIDMLTQKLNTLSEQVDELLRAQSK